MSKEYKNMAVLTGYELALSKLLKGGADVWLNNPVVPREASGTSGMTAAMNGAVNLSTNDGWIPEFIDQGKNGFVFPLADYSSMSAYDCDTYDLNTLYNLLENDIVPLYYDNHDAWRELVQSGMRDVRHQFDSNRMAHEYYQLMYNVDKSAPITLSLAKDSA